MSSLIGWCQLIRAAHAQRCSAEADHLARAITSALIDPRADRHPVVDDDAASFDAAMDALDTVEHWCQQHHAPTVPMVIELRRRFIESAAGLKAPPRSSGAAG